MKKPDETKQLTAKQAIFVEEYLIDLNATKAAVRAKYSEKTANTVGPRLLVDVGVQQAIQKSMVERSERTEITQDYVLQGIKETIERCRQIAPVLDKDGDPVMVETPQGEMVPAFTFRANDALRGYELLGKHLGLFDERFRLLDKGGESLTLNVHFVSSNNDAKTIDVTPKQPALTENKDAPDET